MNNTVKGLVTAIIVAVFGLLAYIGYDGTFTPPELEPPDTVIEPPDTTPEPPDSTPESPFVITADAETGPRVRLSWNDSVPVDITGMAPVRSSTGEPGSFSNLITGDLSADPREYLDNTVLAGETYYYRLRWHHTGNTFSASSIASATLPADTMPTEPPDTTEPEPPDTVPPTEPPDTTGGVGEPIGDWPDNEPPGMTMLTHVDGSSIDWPGWNKFGGDKWTDPERIRIVVDPDSKYGRAVEKRLKVGDVSGWGDPIKGGYRGAGQILPKRQHREVYVRLVIKLSSNYDYHDSGDKLWLSNADGGADTGTSFYVRGGTLYAGGHFRGPHITARQWRPIVPGSPTFAGGPNFQTGPFVRMVRGQYHTIEVWKRASDPGQANGCLRLWIDDVEYTRFAVWGDEDYLDTSMCDVEWINTDQTATQGVTSRMECCIYLGGQNDIKAVDDYARIAEVFVSARN